MPYALGAVKPHVRDCAERFGTQYGIRTIYGVGVRSGPSEHPKGLALDFMCDVPTGRRLREDLRRNWVALGIRYIIHEQSILESPDGQWTRMEDRGGVTANHFDHVHVSFNAAPGSGSVTLGISGDPNAPWNTDPGSLSPANPVDAGVEGIGNILSFITNGNNWWRMFLFLSGTIMLIVFAYRAIGNPLPALAKKVK